MVVTVVSSHSATHPHLAATRRRHRAHPPTVEEDSDDDHVPSWHHHSQFSSKRQKLDSPISRDASISPLPSRSSSATAATIDQFVVSPISEKQQSPPTINNSFNNNLPTPESTPPSSDSESSSPRRRVSPSSDDDAVASGINVAPSDAPQNDYINHNSNSQKDRFVAGLVGASVIALESIWGKSICQTSTDESSVLPIHYFIKEVLRRSRTSCSTLQVALYYLHKSRREIRAALARCAVDARDKKDQDARDGYPSPPLSPTESLEDLLAKSKVESGSEDDGTSPVLCGRRMFLAALITASKFLQDKNYSNRAWAKISGLSPREITKNERCFLGLIGWECFVGASEFDRWTERLSTLACTSLSFTNSASLVTSSSSLPIARPKASSASVRTALAQAQVSWKGVPVRSAAEYPVLPILSIVEQHGGRPGFRRAPSASEVHGATAFTFRA